MLLYNIIISGKYEMIQPLLLLFSTFVYYMPQNEETSTPT